VNRWQITDRMRRPHIRKATSRLTEAFRRQIAAGLYEISRGAPGEWQSRLEVGLREGQAEVDRALTLTWQGVTEDFAVRSYRRIKRMAGKAVDPPAWLARLLLRVVDIFEIRLGLIRQGTIAEIVQQITQSDTLRVALNEGWGIDRMVRAFEETVEMPRYRIERIARTEVIGASNWSTHAGAGEAATEMGLDLVKEWIATRDERTRDMIDDEFDHRAMDGKLRRMDQPFMVPSTFGSEPLQFPGDPAGSAGNIINCRCTIAYVPADEVDQSLL
jgi:hypothetical protein